jgi:sarcosine oxidase gamma subunit
LAGDDAEEDLDHVQPQAAGRREMQCDSWVLVEPGGDQEPHPRIEAADAARSLAESSTRQAFANAKVEIEGLAAQLDKGQALDLRWTIIGLFISAGGAWLSYWV